MVKKYYAVIGNQNEQKFYLQGGFWIGRFTEFNKADQAARKLEGRLFEFGDRPLEDGEDYNIRGKLIKDYSSKTST